ncbi:uncharacterized protein LOC127258449 [Andrographis paniculata]|uniref:uncharacterized protein LOC127258449 n=1 Tax=Andrographis paniculata TaxID=175694 RepID=UPI0021E9A309|nr:uncharacterized protein LOC127258449 [Andrographis paniculata]XP_051141249.1 uncharacterized protein LOC127258449 [Andrographis paniculata]
MNPSSDEFEKQLYHVCVVQKDGKRDVGVKKMSQHTQNPSRDIINPPLAPVYNLSLQERLEGWELQIRKRNNSNSTDKYYIHLQASHRFRSLKEVALFILYGCEMKHLREQERIQKEEEMKIFSWPLNNPIVDL